MKLTKVNRVMAMAMILGLASGLVALARPIPSMARSGYASATGQSCGACHVNPGGDGPRNAIGQAFEAIPTHFTDPAGAWAQLSSPSPTPTPTPSPSPSPEPSPGSNPPSNPLVPTPTPPPAASHDDDDDSVTEDENDEDVDEDVDEDMDEDALDEEGHGDQEDRGSKGSPAVLGDRQPGGRGDKNDDNDSKPASPSPTAQPVPTVASGPVPVPTASPQKDSLRERPGKDVSKPQEENNQNGNASKGNDRDEKKQDKGPAEVKQNRGNDRDSQGRGDTRHERDD